MKWFIYLFWIVGGLIMLGSVRADVCWNRPICTNFYVNNGTNSSADGNNFTSAIRLWNTGSNISLNLTRSDGVVLFATAIDNSAVGGGGGNPFNQILNTTYNASFNSVNVSHYFYSTACNVNEVLKWNGGEFTCQSDANSGGDITAVNGIAPYILGSTSSGDASIDFNESRMNVTAFNVCSVFNDTTYINNNFYGLSNVRNFINDSYGNNTYYLKTNPQLFINQSSIDIRNFINDSYGNLTYYLKTNPQIFINTSGETDQIFLVYKPFTLNTTTLFAGDVSGLYNALDIGAARVGDAELNKSQITLADLTNDRNYIANGTSASLTQLNVTNVQNNTGLFVNGTIYFGVWNGTHWITKGASGLVTVFG